MSKRKAQEYARTHLAAIKAEVRQKRQDVIDAELGERPEAGTPEFARWRRRRTWLRQKVKYATHKTEVALRKRVPDGVDKDGEPKTREQTTLLTPVTIPAVDGVTVEIATSDHTGGRVDGGAPKGNRVWSSKLNDWVVAEGQGSIVRIKTESGVLEDVEGYVPGREAGKPKWRAKR